MKLSFELLALALTILAIVSLQPLVGDTLANTIMWGIAGWQLGSFARTLGSWMYNKFTNYEQTKNRN